MKSVDRILLGVILTLGLITLILILCMPKEDQDSVVTLPPQIVYQDRTITATITNNVTITKTLTDTITKTVEITVPAVINTKITSVGMPYPVYSTLTKTITLPGETIPVTVTKTVTITQTVIPTTKPPCQK